MSSSSVEGGSDPTRPVLLHREGGVVTVTLNQPRRKNAMTLDAWRLLGEHLAGVTLVEDRVVVLTGAGEDFCAGADLTSDDGDSHQLAKMAVVNDACLALQRCPVPTIARVDGVAVGAGMNMALGCDFVLASDRARFSEIFIKRGLSVDFGGAWVLPRLVGVQKAKELVLLGEILSASEAREFGLVNRVVPPGDLDALVQDFVTRLVANPPVAASLSKRMLNDSWEMGIVQALDAEASNQAINIAMEDAREAFEAFREKREPQFQGR